MKKPLKIFTHAYKLSSPWHGEKHEGALVKIEWPMQVVGYADVHPWPELGDPDLKAQIRSLTELSPLPMMKRAISVAYLDGVARREGRSLFTGYQIPFSHFLIPDLLKVTESQLAEWEELGYQILKVKLGKSLATETKHLNGLLEKGGHEFKWRLDFNSRLSLSEFESWVKQNEMLLSRVDAIEDPPLKASTSLPVFADREVVEDWNKVVKPECEEVPSELPGRRIIFTNNLGHPFGHSAAMALSARSGTHEICGLQGMQSYEASAWTESIRYHGPLCLPPVGTGFGFDHLLKRLQWEKQV